MVLPLLVGPAVAAGVKKLSKSFKDDIDPYGSLNPEQRQLVQALGPKMVASANAGPSQFMYGGQMTAPIEQGEEAAIARSARLAALGEATTNNMAYDPLTFNKQFEDEIGAPTMEFFRKYEQPIIEESLPSFSTARGVAVREGLRDVENSLLQTRFQAREAAKDRTLTGLGTQADLVKQDALLQSMPREIKQAGLDREFANFIQANDANLDSVNSMLSFLGISTVTRTKNPMLEFLMQGLKTGAQVASAAGGGA